MADNIDVTPGTGATVAADEISSVKYQRIKVTLGADGTNDGDVSSTNPMPVAGAVTVPGVATSANQTNGTQQTKITDGTDVADVIILSTNPVSTDKGLLVQAVLHGLSSAGGGTYVDVKVNPSGTLQTDVTTSVLPTGASTETTLAAILAKIIAAPATAANQTSELTKLDSIISALASVPVTGTFWQTTQPVSAASLPLPSGAATSANQATEISSLSSIDSKLAPTVATADKKILDMGSTNITTSAYVQLIASTSAAMKHIEIFSPTAEVLILSLGGSGSEVDQFYITPGGNGLIAYDIPAGTRISLKSATATVSSGNFVFNGYTK